MQKFRYLIVGVTLGALAAIALNVQSNNSATDTLSKLRDFTQVFESIKRFYVDEVSDEKLLDDAIKGMLSSLDPHSSYLPPKKYTNLQEATKGQFGGLGIEVTMSKEGYVKVITPIDDTPAFRAGIKAGDLIVKIESTPIKGLTLGQAVEKMRGEVGTKIKISILRDGEAKLLDKEITRDYIQIRSVRSQVLEPNYGYVRVSRFQAPTAKQLNEHIAKLLESEKDLKGLVLDLRNNPGGLLNSAIDVSSTFMDGGLVVYTKGRIANQNNKYFALNGDRLEGKPIIVLINEGSASASEIVAGALQDSKRAIIMGRRSFGKGSVQSVFELKDSKSGLKLTTAKYYTPSGRTIQAKGIEPDIELPILSVDIPDTKPKATLEKDLPGHLENEQSASASTSTDTTNATATTTTTATTKVENKLSPIGSDKLLRNDYELLQALNMLKGLTFRQ